MKLIQTSFLRAAIAVVMGILLIKYGEDTVTWLTVCIGVLFFISGLISCIVYLVGRNSKETAVIDENGNPLTDEKPAFPIVGLGSLVFGAALSLFPTLIASWMIYILGAALILGAIGQYVALASVSRLGRISIFYWLMPSVVLIIGFIAIVKPMWIATAPLLFIGWTMIFYGIVECINTFRAMNIRRKVAMLTAEKQAAEEAQAEQTASDTSTNNEENAI